ncbi:MAG: PP2C family protein-serine/threonine phosphatase [Thermodesulfobacteriota bacterium]
MIKTLPHHADFDAEANRLITMLEYQARQTDSEINKKLLMELVRGYAEAERELAEKQRQIEEDLRAGAMIQKTMLPQALPVTDNFRFASRFIPCNFLGGDMFTIFPVTEEIVGIAILDVSGHGVPAALVTVSVAQTLQETWSNSMPHSPKEVVESLEKDYPFERFEKFFTMVYLLLDTSSGQLHYCNAGHPPPLLLRQNGSVEPLEMGGGIVGLSGMLDFEEGEKQLRPGDTLLLHTDGLIEHQNLREEFFGLDRLTALLPSLRLLEPEPMLDQILASAMAFGKGCPVRDDIALLAIRSQEEKP